MTEIDDDLKWHREALELLRLRLPVDVVNDEPHCGWFRRKLVKGGVYVPARIWIERDRDDDGNLIADERMLCEVNGEPRDAVEEWSHMGDQPISEPEFYFLTASLKWAREHSPNEPLANPRRPVDWRDVPLPKFGETHS